MRTGGGPIPRDGAIDPDENLTGLAAINRELLARVETMEASRRVATCCHPRLLFNREGDCLAVKLRPGNVHRAEDWDRVFLPEIEQQQKQTMRTNQPLGPIGGM